MSLKITRDVDKVLIYFTFLEMLFLRWLLIGQDTILLCSCIFIVFRLLWIHRTVGWNYKKNIYLLLLLLIYMFLSSISRVSFNGKIFCNNLYYMFLPAVWISYFGYLIRCRLELLDNCFENLRRPLNVYYIVNFVVILLQRGQTYFLMPVDRIENTYYEDHIAGLLGIEGTHRLALFTVFVILLNFRCIMRKIRNGKVPLMNSSFLIVVVVTAIYSSSINDNNMLFLLMPFFILAFYMYTPGNSRGKIFNTILLLFVIFTLLYFVTTSSYIAEVLGSRISSVITSIQKTTNGTQISDERMIYLVFALSQMNGWLFGVGFGSVNMRQDASIVRLGYQFRNWGMSDISPLVAMGGVIYYIVLLCLYANILIAGKSEKRGRKYAFIIMLVLTYYHQVLTHSTMAIPMCWIITLFKLQEYNADTEDCYVKEIDVGRC